eukprot:Opistho-2@46401
MNFTKGGVEQEYFLGQEDLQRLKETKHDEFEKIQASKDVKVEETVFAREKIDTRPLFEQLQEQKDKKQSEFEEKLMFKNQIYNGLDEDEYSFINSVQQKREIAENERWEEAINEVRAFREQVAKVAEIEPAITPMTTVTSHIILPSKPPSIIAIPGKKSQSELLAGVVRPKRKSTDPTPAHAKGAAVEEANSATSKRQKTEETAASSVGTVGTTQAHVTGADASTTHGAAGSTTVGAAAAGTSGLGLLSALCAYGSDDEDD